MGDFLQILLLVTVGIVLLWFIYSVLMGQWMRLRRGGRKPGKSRARPGSVIVGDPKVCLVCRAKLEEGELIETQAFPSMGGSREKQMHIQGCVYCLSGERERSCPVCAAVLSREDKLIAKLFDRSLRRHHVHILGCDYCRMHKRRPPAFMEKFGGECDLAPTTMPK